MERSSLTTQKETNIANPYIPTGEVEACEQEREKRLVWVLPVFLASGAIAMLFAWICLQIELQEPHTDSSFRYRLSVYGCGITAMASSAIWTFLLVCYYRRWVPGLALLLLIPIALVCACFGLGLISSYESDQHIRDAVRANRFGQ